jgi:hypothetical protein
MKRECYILLLFFAAILTLGSCNKTDDGSSVSPITLYEKVSGKWAMVSVAEVDEIAVAHADQLTTIDLTPKFNYTTFKLLLNVDAAGNPTSYEVQGDVPELFSKAGFWKLDYPFPHTDASSSKILLYSDTAKTQLTNELVVTTIPGSKKLLEFKLTRVANQIPYLSYQFSLKPATN